MRLALIASAALVCSALSGCAAADPKVAVAADAATTGMALSAVPGATELNPLGWASVPLRALVIEHARRQPIAEGLPILNAVEAASWGAAANNLLVIGGATTPVSLGAGLLLGLLAWNHGAQEREFWALCAHMRRENRELACEYTRPS